MAGVMQIKLIESKNLTEHMERHNSLLYHENHIRKDLAKIQECSVYIGYHLMDIEDGKLFDTVYHQGSHDYCKNIYQYAFQELDISKTTTFNLMTVARKFSYMRTGLNPEYIDYSFSQLVELTTVPENLHKYFYPQMTIKDMRALKRGERVGYKSEKGFAEYSQIPVELFPTSEKSENKIIESCSDVGTETIEIPNGFEYENHVVRALPPEECVSDEVYAEIMGTTPAVNTKTIEYKPAKEIQSYMTELELILMSAEERKKWVIENIDKMLVHSSFLRFIESLFIYKDSEHYQKEIERIKTSMQEQEPDTISQIDLDAEEELRRKKIMRR